MNASVILDHNRKRVRDMTLEEIQIELFQLTAVSPQRHTAATQGRLIALQVVQRELLNG